MTRRFLPAWLLMAFMASSAMLPAVASAQSVSPQNGVRGIQNVQRRVDNRTYANAGAYANSNRWGGNRIPTYRQPSRVSRSVWQPPTRRHRAHRMTWRDYRRR
jgi:hypothetical protein